MTNIKDALELAANVLLGAETAATLERNYAKGSEYEENRKVIETTLSQLTASPDRDKVARIINPEAFSISPSVYGLKTQDEMEKQTVVGAVRAIARDKADAILATIAPDEAAIQRAIEAGARAAEDRYLRADARYQEAIRRYQSAESELIKARRERSAAWQEITAAQQEQNDANH